MATFIHPAPGCKTTSVFGYRVIGGKREFHQGIDYAKSGNVPILASADGTVKQYISDGTTYGKVLFIEHKVNGKQMDTTYAHLKSKSVKAGDKVKQGQIIGYMGNTGRSTGQHLHFEIHDGAWKSGQPNAVDPEKYVGKDLSPKPVVDNSRTAIGTVVFNTSLNIRKGASLTTQAVGTVSVNKQYNVYSIVDGRFYEIDKGFVSNPSEKYGKYTPIKVVTPVPQPAPVERKVIGKLTTLVDNLHHRRGAGSSAPSLGKFSKGTVLDVYGKQGDFYELNEGFVSSNASYVKFLTNEQLAPKPVTPVVPAKKRIYLPKTVEKWSIYPTNKAPIKANAIASLNPKKFGGLDYEILGNPQTNVYTIKTTNYGLVNIVATPTSGAIIK